MYGIVWAQVTADMLTVLLSLWVLRRCRPALPPRPAAARRIALHMLPHFLCTPPKQAGGGLCKGPKLRAGA